MITLQQIFSLKIIRKRSYILQTTKNKFFLTTSNIITFLSDVQVKCLLKETKLKEKKRNLEWNSLIQQWSVR